MESKGERNRRRITPQLFQKVSGEKKRACYQLQARILGSQVFWQRRVSSTEMCFAFSHSSLYIKQWPVSLGDMLAQLLSLDRNFSVDHVMFFFYER
jgi:hypothetical protein